MDLSFLLPNSDYEVESGTIDELPALLRLTIRPYATTVCCPCCGISMKRVHSHYKRQLKDISCSGRQVAIAINVRRFFCDNSACERQIFTERLTGLAAPHARRTKRLVELMQAFGLLLGGAASIQILRRLPINSSRWTVLRDVRKMSLTAGNTPRVLGIDDWALRRGHRYGTILVDMETTRVIELLPDRKADTVTAWLKSHPGVEIISRDRGGAYAQAARQGAPQAIQVADRWHLFKNLGEALTNLFGRYRRALKQMTAESIEMPKNADVKLQTAAIPIRSLPNQKRFERFELVRQLREDGLTITAIANQIPLDRKTIRKYLNTDRFPDWYSKGSPKRVSKLAPYKDYLLSHGLDGHRTVRQLWRDIQEQGFMGSLSIVAEFMAATHYPTSVPIKHTDTPVQGTPKSEKLTPRQATWLMLSAPDKLTDDERQQAQRVAQLNPEVAHMVSEAQSFASMLRQQTVDSFDSWLQRTRLSTVRELRTFARGIGRDYDAVKAALVLPWNNGLVEGHVNRLKFVKRQMFGRAKFDLLRLRVLFHSPT